MLDRLRQKPPATPPPQAAPKQPADKDESGSPQVTGAGHDFSRVQVQGSGISYNTVNIDEMAGGVRVQDGKNLPPGMAGSLSQAVKDRLKATAEAATQQAFKKEFSDRYKEIRGRLPKGADMLPEEPFDEPGQDALDPKGPVSGHTEARQVRGWGKGFNALQNYLNQSAAWSDAHEDAQHLIRDYALWKLRQSPGDVPENVKEFTKYIGRSEANAKATDLYNYKRRQAKQEEAPRPVDLGGYAGAADWCAGASSQAFMNTLLERGLTVGDYDKWLSSGKGKSLHSVDQNAYDAPLYPGDVITVITQVTPLTGHIATVADYDPDTKRILIVSGNAGGGGAQGVGTIRFDEVTREMPPKDYVYSQVADLAKTQTRLEREQQQIQKGAARDVQDWVEDPKMGMSHAVLNPTKQQAALKANAEKLRKVQQDPMLQTRQGKDMQSSYSPKPTTTGTAWVTRIYRLGKLMKPGALDQMSKEELTNLGIVRRQPRPKAKK